MYQALFSIPLHEDSQYFFVFRFKHKILIWCTMPQRLTESLSDFSQIVKKDLESFQLPCNSVSVQYIDDLVVASKTKEDCKLDTIALLNHLADNGRKVSPTKMQYCQREVIYLGHHIEKGARKVSKECVSAILNMNPPITQTEVRMVLRIVDYCCQ